MTPSTNITFWLTGLSGSGKTSVSQAFFRELQVIGVNACIIDGDELRSGICKDLGFNTAARSENVRRAAHMAKILNKNGILAIVAMISPFAADRASAFNIIGNDRCFEIHISTPLEVCEFRDPKGLYSIARREPSSQMTGIQSPYEPPKNSALTIDTSLKTPTSSANELIALLHSKI